MIRACIFDLDGVIVDTAKYHYLAWKRLAAELGIDLTEANNEKLKGVDRMRSLEFILKLGNVSLDDGQKTALADRKNQWFVEYINELTEQDILPGVEDFLQELKSDGVRIALASSSKNAPTVIRLLGVDHYFEVVVDGSMITHAKPDPEIFLTAAQMLRVNPAECIVFEDAEAGVEAALAAGMRCIGIGNAAQLAKANAVVPGLFAMKAEQLI